MANVGNCIYYGNRNHEIRKTFFSSIPEPHTTKFDTVTSLDIVNAMCYVRGILISGDQHIKVWNVQKPSKNYLYTT